MGGSEGLEESEARNALVRACERSSVVVRFSVSVTNAALWQRIHAGLVERQTPPYRV